MYWLLLLIFIIILTSLIMSMWNYHDNIMRTRIPTPTRAPIPKDHLMIDLNPGIIEYTDDEAEVFFIIKVYCDIQYAYLSNAKFYAVTDDGVMYDFMNYYDGLKPDDYSGQIFGNDNDQYSHYFFSFPIRKVQITRVFGYPLNNVNYWSLIIGDRKNLILYKTMNGASDTCRYSYNNVEVDNPFVKGSKTSNCYPISDENNFPARYFQFGNFTTIFDIFKNRWNDEKKILPGFFDKQTGRIGVFRVDKETSMNSFISEEVKTTCFDNYLFSSVQYRSNLKPIRNFSYQDFISYGIIRVPIIDGYVSDMECGTWSDDYDVAYFSVTFHVSDKLVDPPLLPFWTVNLRMLKEIADVDGYAYIFWAPYDDVVAQMKSYDQREPPIIQWGGRKGYLLQTPTGRIIYRYKQVNKKWKGYPGNAPCYDTYEENRPIQNELSDGDINYCPTLYGQEFDNYQEFIDSDRIGAVTRDGDWPIQ